MTDAKPELRNDSRWQLIERIAASSSFQKSERVRDLLRYLAEKTLRGDTQDLSEHRIGIAVFGKSEDYSIVEDSSVRVHVRQLRLKLHEYFDADGREETCVVEIPKGSYTAVFRSAEQRANSVENTTGRVRLAIRLLPWVLAAFFFITSLELGLHRATRPPTVPPSWPLSSLFENGNQPVQVVVADANYGLIHLLSGQQVTLQQYLSPAYRSGETVAYEHMDKGEAQVLNYLSGSVLTSYADLAVTTTLMRLSGDARDRLAIRSARNLTPRDFDAGNFVLVGGPASNPWTSYFQDKLNFQEREGAPGSSAACFENLHPKPGEQKSYCGLPFTGSSGVDFATIAYLPLPSGHGNALILQGLQQEGTEAAGVFLSDAAKMRELQSSLGISASSVGSVYWEALIRTQSIAGAPMGTSSLVVTRLLRP